MAESRLVIGVAGRIGSGKTEVAHLLESQFSFQYVRYSLVLAKWFGADPSAKPYLQQVGWKVMSGDRQRELNRRLIEEIDRTRDCVVDGLRHPIDLESLGSEFGRRFMLIFVHASPAVRFERLRSRYATYAEFAAADSHPVEANIDSMRKAASEYLSGTLPIDQLVAELGRIVATLRTSQSKC